MLILGDQYKDFTNSLSTLINFHLTSMQIQLQMISPINYNLNSQNEKVIMSSEVKTKIYKPNVLISLPKPDGLNKLSSKTSMFNTFFGGKENQDANKSTLILEVKNSTSKSPISLTLNPLKYNQSFKNIENAQYTENPFNLNFIPLLSTTNNYDEISNINNNIDDEKKLLIDGSKLNINAVHLQGNITFSFFYQYSKISMYQNVILLHY